MKRRRAITLGIIGGTIALALLLFGKKPQEAAARRAAQPNEVLESLQPTAREANELRKILAADPKNLAAATRLARLDIEASRTLADPRYLGQAQAVLAPWWNDQAPAEVLVLRATIEQSLHDFESALHHLDLALAAVPTNLQALLTRSIILTVLGRYDEAREGCKKLAPLADDLTFAVCETQIDALMGKAKPSYERLKTTLEKTTRATVDESVWAFSSLAEYAARFGDVGSAEKHFRRALELAPDDAYVRGALADLLTDAGRADEAVTLTSGPEHERNDALLLRCAIAEKRAGKAAADKHTVMLAERFDASRARGDVVHRREEARFWLELNNDPDRAYELAKANWEVQREPWDARVFLAAAAAAKKSASPVREYVTKTGLEGTGISR